jgi:phenylpropionate dioxygenase-like ring-hydroxylating dioxygenase large terminal subunit
MTDRSEELLALTRRALCHFQNRTTDQADAIMSMPVAAYTDPERYEREVDRVFRHLPLALALSLELPEPGTYLAMDQLNAPVLLVRGQDGVVRAFLNACRHRGAPVCELGRGSARVFACPYHAWTYNTQGELVGRYRGETFGDVDETALGLTELACAERSGLIWVTLSPDETFDIDEWLGPFQAELDTLKLTDWHIYQQRDIPGPGWKVTMDGYLEVYHHDSVHGKTVGEHTIGNLLVHDTYGPHQRMVFGRRSLAALEGKRESEWVPGQDIRLIHSGFPNLSVSGILGDHCLVSHIFPGPTLDTTITRQTVLAAKPPETEAEKQASETFSAMVLKAVRDEDYAMGLRIQSGLASGANREFLFGRNEPAVQNYHRWIARFMN